MLLFSPGQRGVKASIKKNIRLFKGFPKDSQARSERERFVSHENTPQVETNKRLIKVLEDCEVAKQLKFACYS
jgi:hypothetical protein